MLWNLPGYSTDASLTEVGIYAKRELSYQVNSYQGIVYAMSFRESQEKKEIFMSFLK